MWPKEYYHQNLHLVYDPKSRLVHLYDIALVKIVFSLTML